MELHQLRDTKDTTRVIEQVLALDDAPRTQYFEIANGTTQFSLVLVLAEGYDEAPGEPPQGFQKDTGLTVTGQNVAPGATSKGVIQPSINVQATHCKCSLHWRRIVQPFDEGDLNLQDAFAPAGEFFLFCGWTVEEHAVRGAAPTLVGRNLIRKKSR